MPYDQYNPQMGFGGFNQNRMQAQPWGQQQPMAPQQMPQQPQSPFWGNGKFTGFAKPDNPYDQSDAFLKQYGVPPQFWGVNSKSFQDFNSYADFDAYRTQWSNDWNNYLATVSPNIREILSPSMSPPQPLPGQYTPGQPPIGLPPLPPGMIYDGHPSTWPGAVQQQPPGQPPIGLPPLPPPGYQGDNVMNPVPGQFGQPMEGNRTMGTQPRNPMEGVMQGGRPTPIPRMSMGTIGGGFNQLPMQPVTQPIQQVSPLQQMGNPFGQGGGMQKTTPQKRIPKGSMYGGMERL